MSVVHWLLAVGSSSGVAFGRGQGMMGFCIALGLALTGDTGTALQCAAVGAIMYAVSGVQEWAEKR